jgi:hypothetical protein
MTGPNPILDAIGPVEGFARRAEHAVGHLFRHHHDAPPGATMRERFGQCHAADACTMDPRCELHPGCVQAEAAAGQTGTATPPKENPMSLTSDVEQGYAAVKSELAKFDTALPGLLNKAKAFEASPFASLAEKAAASILPPEAVAIAVNGADRALDDLIALYTPAQAATDTAAPVAPAPVTQ